MAKERRGRKGEGHLFKRGKFWSYKAPDGKIHATHTTIQSEAIQFKNRILAGLNSDQPHIKIKTKGATVNELLDAHLRYMRLKARKSVEDVEYIVEKWLKPYFGDRVASSLNSSDFEKYRNDRSPTHTPSSINRHLSYLRSGFHTGRDRNTPRLVELIPVFPMADEAYNVRQGFIEYDGYQKLLSHLPPSLKPLFVCSYHVSSRKGELKNILWPQVDLKDGLIVLDHSDTKNKQGRALPIYSDMIDALRDQKALRDAEFPECEYVFFWHTSDCFISHGGRRTVAGDHIKDFRASWKKAVEAAGYPGLLFHDLRRSAVRNMRKAGIDQKMRMMISGHKTDSMERRYNILTADDVKEAKRAMEVWAQEQKAQVKR
jgi:integrase